MRSSCSEAALTSWLEAAVMRWPTQEDALAHLEAIRWNGKPACLYCGSHKVFLHREKNRRAPRRQCGVCRKSFSVTVGTIFHYSRLPITTWFLAVITVFNARKKVRATMLSRTLGLPYPTAWYLIKRIRHAMLDRPEQERLLRDIVAVDDQRRCGSSASK